MAATTHSTHETQRAEQSDAPSVLNIRRPPGLQASVHLGGHQEFGELDDAPLPQTVLRLPDLSALVQRLPRFEWGTASIGSIAQWCGIGLGALLALWLIFGGNSPSSPQDNTTSEAAAPPVAYNPPPLAADAPEAPRWQPPMTNMPAQGPATTNQVPAQTPVTTTSSVIPAVQTPEASAIAPAASAAEPAQPAVDPSAAQAPMPAPPAAPDQPPAPAQPAEQPAAAGEAAGQPQPPNTNQWPGWDESVQRTKPPATASQAVAPPIYTAARPTAPTTPGAQAPMQPAAAGVPPGSVQPAVPNDVQPLGITVPVPQ